MAKKENGKHGAFAWANKDDYQEGLTKREYFAGLAMEGILKRVKTPLALREFSLIAEESVLMADALLEELEKTPKTN